MIWNKLFIPIFLLILHSCKIYSFSGATIPSEVKSMTLNNIENKAVNSWSSLERIFNFELKQKMINDAGMKIIDNDGDYRINGYISNYSITPQSLTQGEATIQYSINLTVNINFEDVKTEKKVTWSENFNSFVVYSNDISGKEEELITVLSKEISNKIFNKIYSSW